MKLDAEDIAAIVEALGDLRAEPPFYTVQSLAARLNLSDKQVRRMLKEKRIPHYVVEGCYRFDPADVETYLQQRREEAR